MEFGFVAFGDSDALAAVTATHDDGRGWIVSHAHTRIDEGTVQRCAHALAENARRMAAAADAPRFAPELIAYVRSLPEGRKSHYLGSADRYLVREAEADVLDALQAALERDDPYRAAVEFETRVPYLVADRGLIDVMDSVHAAFMASYDRDRWLVEAAEAAEAEVAGTQPFMAVQIAAWRQADQASGRPASR